MSTPEPGPAAWEPGVPAGEPDPEVGRRLFRYVVFDEWRDYRRIMGVFAGTFFSEFSPEDVGARLRESGVELDPATVLDRLERLREWGNLTVSSATGTPTSLADYYRRRNRYLITRAGQEVHDLVEGVLSSVDEIRDVSTGRLRALLDALRALLAVDPLVADPERLADLVGAVFDPHQAFTSEITQFFAALNQWQSRYDLTPEELRFFAHVLVGYVTERLEDIERLSRPIGAALRELAGRIPAIVERANRGLAARVEAAGLADAVAVARRPGSAGQDWDHLAGWFVGDPQRPARMDRLRGEALAAVRTLTLNLIRLSRVGVGTSSRRADLLRLAKVVADATPEDASRLVNAALGLYPARHLGALPTDADDPVGAGTSWWDAPLAVVPVSLRERGDTTARGTASPLPDRSAARRAIARRREQEAVASRRVDVELLALGRLDGTTVSAAGLARLEQLLGRALAQLPVGAKDATVTDGAIALRVERRQGVATQVRSPDGTLRVRDLDIVLRAAGGADEAMAAVGGRGAT